MPGAILVPVDGSNFAEHALPCGLAIARRTGATVHLVLVHVPYQPATARSPIADLVEARAAEQTDRESGYMAELSERLASSGVRTRAALIHGPVREALTTYVEEHAVDVVVMTTHGRGGFQRAWLGSTADSLMRQCPAPLLLIRPRSDECAAARASDDMVFRRLLVALDGSQTAEQALRAAVSLHLTQTASLVLAHVLQPPFADTSPYLPNTLPLGKDEMASRQASARQYLAEVAGADWLGAEAIETRVAVDYDPARAVLDMAAANDSDLVVLGTHGRGGLRRMLMGSVADKVIRGTHRAVLVHRGLPRQRPGTRTGPTAEHQAKARANT